MAEIDTLVDDVKDVLKNVIQGDSHEIEEGTLGDFGESVSKAIQRALTARSEPRPPKTLYMSEIGKPCVRQIWYNLRHEEYGEVKEDLLPHAKIKFMYGDILEELLLFFARQAGHEVAMEQESFKKELPNGWVVKGRIDAVIDGILVDVKSASSYAFKKFKENRVPEDDPFGYMKQLEYYARGMVEKYGALPTKNFPVAFLAIDKTTGNIVLDRYTIDIAKDPTEWEQELVDKLEGERPPARPFNEVPMGKSGNHKLPVECSYCPWKWECWSDANEGDGLRAFAYSSGPVFMTYVAKEPNVPEITQEAE